MFVGLNRSPAEAAKGRQSRIVEAGGRWVGIEANWARVPAGCRLSIKGIVLRMGCVVEAQSAPMVEFEDADEGSYIDSRVVRRRLSHCFSVDS